MATLSPAPPGGLKFGGPVPTGVKVLGGTYATVVNCLCGVYAKTALGLGPLPPFWGGYTIRADRVEYWEGRPSRMHERVVLSRGDAGWGIVRLYP